MFFEKKILFFYNSLIFKYIFLNFFLIFFEIAVFRGEIFLKIAFLEKMMRKKRKNEKREGIICG
jgi:hypothetical protein